MKSLQKMVIISVHRLPEGASDIFFAASQKLEEVKLTCTDHIESEGLLALRIF